MKGATMPDKDPLELAVKEAEKRLAKAERAYEKADAAKLDADDELTAAQEAAIGAQTKYHEAKLAGLKAKQGPKGVVSVEDVKSKMGQTSNPGGAMPYNEGQTA